MKVKLFTAMTEGGLENKVNPFLADTSIEVTNIHYSSTIFFFSLLITYKLRA